MTAQIKPRKQLIRKNFPLIFQKTNTFHIQVNILFNSNSEAAKALQNLRKQKIFCDNKQHREILSRRRKHYEEQPGTIHFFR